MMSYKLKSMMIADSSTYLLTDSMLVYPPVLLSLYLLVYTSSKICYAI